jgi:DNA-binding MarR family transcriptional regulator
MKKKLTHRQQEFLSQFLDFYREMDRPVHYVAVAEHLGIGRVTAYEMLRLLEEHDLIRVEFQADPEQHGPGRVPVYFYPTQEARRLLSELSGEPEDKNDWLVVKEQILRQLSEGKAGGYEELLANLLARLPERRTPLIFVTELITAVILMLTKIQDTPEIYVLLERLQQIGLPQKVSLNVMSGIAMLLSVVERTNRHYSTIILAQVKHYEDALSELNEESKRQISEFTREVACILAK